MGSLALILAERVGNSSRKLVYSHEIHFAIHVIELLEDQAAGRQREINRGPLHKVERLGRMKISRSGTDFMYVAVALAEPISSELQGKKVNNWIFIKVLLQLTGPGLLLVSSG